MNVKQRLRKLLNQDPRYKPDAYQFIQEALAYAQTSLGMGVPQATDAVEKHELPDDNNPSADVPPAAVERHISGQQLSEAIRDYALDQFGLMAKTVLKTWGIRTTSDFGEIVYNLIRIGCMKKSKHDRREDFDNVFEFDEAFQQGFKITKPE